MSQIDASPKYQKLWKQILDKQYSKNKPSLRYFVALHASDSDLLKNLATEDPDPRVRKTAVEKITENNLLTSIAIEDGDRKVQETAIGQITDKKSLLMLRLSLESELQGCVNERARELNHQIY